MLPISNSHIDKLILMMNIFLSISDFSGFFLVTFFRNYEPSSGISFIRGHQTLTFIKLHFTIQMSLYNLQTYNKTT